MNLDAQFNDERYPIRAAHSSEAPRFIRRTSDGKTMADLFFRATRLLQTRRL